MGWAAAECGSRYVRRPIVQPALVQRTYYDGCGKKRCTEAVGVRSGFCCYWKPCLIDYCHQAAKAAPDVPSAAARTVTCVDRRWDTMPAGLTGRNRHGSTACLDRRLAMTHSPWQLDIENMNCSGPRFLLLPPRTAAANRRTSQTECGRSGARTLTHRGLRHCLAVKHVRMAIQRWAGGRVERLPVEIRPTSVDGLAVRTQPDTGWGRSRTLRPARGRRSDGGTIRVLLAFQDQTTTTGERGFDLMMLHQCTCVNTTLPSQNMSLKTHISGREN